MVVPCNFHRRMCTPLVNRSVARSGDSQQVQLMVSGCSNGNKSLDSFGLTEGLNREETGTGESLNIDSGAYSIGFVFARLILCSCTGRGRGGEGPGNTHSSVRCDPVRLDRYLVATVLWQEMPFVRQL